MEKSVNRKPQRKFWHAVFETNACLICPQWCRFSHTTRRHLNLKFRSFGGNRKDNVKPHRHFYFRQQRLKRFQTGKIFVAEGLTTNDFVKFCRFYRELVKPAPIKVIDYDAGARKLSKYIKGKQNRRKICEETLRKFSGPISAVKNVGCLRHFAAIPQHFRATGLHGLHKNADAFTCPLCLAWFLDDSICFLHMKISHNLTEIRSIKTVIRNESNLPPDLGNGYRLPLFVVDTCEAACTLCGEKFFEEKTSFYRHLIECGNRAFQQL